MQWDRNTAGRLERATDSCHCRVSGINYILFPMFLLLP